MKPSQEISEQEIVLILTSQRGPYLLLILVVKVQSLNARQWYR